MRVVIQRVLRAAVHIIDEGEEQDLVDDALPSSYPEMREHTRIGPGYLILVGVAATDTPVDARTLATKTATLRVFGDADGKMNLDALATGAEILAVSQFTLLADCRKGRRPSFINAARPEVGQQLYRAYVEHLREIGLVVHTGVFGAHMVLEILNDGPVTIILDSAELTT